MSVLGNDFLLAALVTGLLFIGAIALIGPLMLICYFTKGWVMFSLLGVWLFFFITLIFYAMLKSTGGFL